jgi:hypothetical protein
MNKNKLIGIISLISLIGTLPLFWVCFNNHWCRDGHLGHDKGELENTRRYLNDAGIILLMTISLIGSLINKSNKLKYYIFLVILLSVAFIDNYMPLLFSPIIVPALVIVHIRYHLLDKQKNKRANNENQPDQK